jgi:hypothetical protein
MTFHATRAEVGKYGIPPVDFLSELIAFGQAAPDDIFAPNSNTSDIYSHIKPILGPWESLAHRRAAMLEVMRVHAGHESSWNWHEGVDKTNKTSMANKTGEEAGIFQVSYDSEFLNHGAMRSFALIHDLITPDKFIDCMKSHRQLALEYYARLIRVNIKWAGPIIRGEIDKDLSREAVAEFQYLLA